MKIKWTTTASLIMEAEDTVIAFDPFLGFPNQKAFLKDYRRAKDIFITHGHFDHIYHIPRIYGGRKVKIYTTKTPWLTLLQKGVAPDQLCKIEPGFSTNVGPFEIKTYQGRHCKFDLGIILQILGKFAGRRTFDILRLHRHYPENGEILFYEIHCEGKRIQVMGSMNLDPDVDYPIGADLLIFPLQGRSDQDTYAVDLVNRLMPKRIVIDHHDNSFYPWTSDIDVSGFIRNIDIPCEPFTRNQIIEL